MKCEKCTIREANIHLTQTRNGVVTEHHFCEICAQEQGVGFNLSKYFNSLGGVKTLAGGSIFDTAGGIPAFGSVMEKNTTCPRCGQTFADFRRSGLFGCSVCYDAFADRLDPLMRRVQGSTQHIGRKAHQDVPCQEQNMLKRQLSDLRKSLRQAVEAEEYETAARLRDEVRALEVRVTAADSDAERGGADI
ncbi:MAG: UvrB/UvrC motif-containing protein [Saccharofermentanales bacterium]|jgi:protein arginine kinase activator